MHCILQGRPRERIMHAGFSKPKKEIDKTLNWNQECEADGSLKGFTLVGSLSRLFFPLPVQQSHSTCSTTSTLTHSRLNYIYFYGIQECISSRFPADPRVSFSSLYARNFWIRCIGYLHSLRGQKTMCYWDVIRIQMELWIFYSFTFPICISLDA